MCWRTSCTKALADSEEVVGPGENNSLIDSKIFWKEEKGVLLRSIWVAVQIYASKLNLIRTVLEPVCC